MSTDWAGTAVQDAIVNRLLDASPVQNIAWDAYGGSTNGCPPQIDMDEPENSVWLRPSHLFGEQAVLFGGGFTKSLGSGTLALSIFGPPGLTDLPDVVTPALAGQVVDLFRFQTIDGVTFENVTSQAQYNDPDGVWNVFSFTINFTTELVRPV